MRTLSSAGTQQLDGALRRLDALGHPPAPDAMVRLIKSSGTTGNPKVMGMTYRVQQPMVTRVTSGQLMKAWLRAVELGGGALGGTAGENVGNLLTAAT